MGEDFFTCDECGDVTSDYRCGRCHLCDSMFCMNCIKEFQKEWKRCDSCIEKKVDDDDMEDRCCKCTACEDVSSDEE